MWLEPWVIVQFSSVEKLTDGYFSSDGSLKTRVRNHRQKWALFTQIPIFHCMWHVLGKMTLAQAQTHRLATHSLRRPKIGLHPAYIFLPLCILFFPSKIIIIPHCLSEMWRFCWDWGEKEIKKRKKLVEINGKNNENRAWRRSGKPMWNTHDFDFNKDMRLAEES